MRNPVKEFREERGMNRHRFAEKIGSNGLYIKNAETVGVLTPEGLILKIGLAFDGVDEGKLLNEYREWEVWRNENKT